MDLINEDLAELQSELAFDSPQTILKRSKSATLIPGYEGLEMSLKQRILTLKKILITCHVTAFMTLWETEAG